MNTIQLFLILLFENENKNKNKPTRITKWMAGLLHFTIQFIKMKAKG